MLADQWGMVAIITDDNRDADVDALYVKDDILAGIAEIKCRSMSLEQLRKFGDYLITENKLVRGEAVSKALRVPYMLIVRLSDAVVYWRITDRTGARSVTWETRETETQATCNGGSAVRMNAYLPLDAMRIVPT